MGTTNAAIIATASAATTTSASNPRSATPEINVYFSSSSATQILRYSRH